MDHVLRSEVEVGFENESQSSRGVVLSVLARFRVLLTATLAGVLEFYKAQSLDGGPSCKSYSSSYHGDPSSGHSHRDLQGTGNNNNATLEVGRYSVIGLITHGRTRVLRHTVGESFVDVSVAQRTSNTTVPLEKIKLRESETVWDFLAAYMEQHKAVGGTASSPFWGGLMGYFAYEAGTKAVKCTEDCAWRGRRIEPTTVFADIERSLVVDQYTHKVYVQTLAPRDAAWIRSTKQAIRLATREAKLRTLHGENMEEYNRFLAETKSENENFKPYHESQERHRIVLQEILSRYLKTSIINQPKEKEYRKRVRRCLQYIRAGDSYELCLTDRATIQIPKKSIDMSWELYKNLRDKNPGPFAAYFCLNDTTVVSSSPERFLSWTRDGQCQLRPIKGTVKKAPGIDLQEATHLLASEKERAENLMIVDLIRHDLHSTCDVRSVKVPKLMVVEEYETVYQLVSVIEGRIKDVKPNIHAVPEYQEKQAQARSQPRTRSRPQEAETVTPTPKAPTPPPEEKPFIGYTGLDVLQNAFPPGSMTGAPKLASCTILHKLEGHKPRGIYSGALGYMCAGGGGDFSVLIRCAYRYDKEVVKVKPDGDGISNNNNNGNDQSGPGEKANNEDKTSENDTQGIDHEIWRIGAGGAVTALSDDRAEWEEMKTKLDSTLAAFMPLPATDAEEVNEAIAVLRAQAVATLDQVRGLDGDSSTG